MFRVLILACSSFCIPVAPSSMLSMCHLLRAVFNFDCPPLINKVLAAVELDRFEVFKHVWPRDMCLNFGRMPWIKAVHVVCAYWYLSLFYVKHFCTLSSDLSVQIQSTFKSCVVLHVDASRLILFTDVNAIAYESCFVLNIDASGLMLFTKVWIEHWCLRADSVRLCVVLPRLVFLSPCRFAFCSFTLFAVSVLFLVIRYFTIVCVYGRTSWIKVGHAVCAEILFPPSTECLAAQSFECERISQLDLTLLFCGHLVLFYLVLICWRAVRDLYPPNRPWF